MGNLLAITVHAANIHDTKSGINPAKKAYEKYSAIQRFCGDDGYLKSFEKDVLEQLGLVVDISKRTKPVVLLTKVPDPIILEHDRTLLGFADCRN